MFETVKGQGIALTMLEHEIQRASLPQTLLFHGPDGCGKFFTAIELARLVNCREQREPECACTSCRAISKLIDRDLFIVCRSNLRNSFDLWKRFGVRESNLHLFARDLRRVALSIADDEKYGKELLHIQDVLGFPSALIEQASSVLNDVYRVLESQKRRIVTIDTVREIQRFLSLKSANGRYRVVIIDGAERMNEEASNSFLKISEDTPPDSLILLITSQKDSLRETIRSRCRSYRFIGLSKDTLREIIQLHFQSAEGADSPILSPNMDTVKEYYRLLTHPDCSVTKRAEIASDITAKGHTAGFLDYLAAIVMERYHSSLHHTIEKLYEIEALLKRISFIKKAVLTNNLNQESALTDFMLNSFSDIENL